MDEFVIKIRRAEVILEHEGKELKKYTYEKKKELPDYINALLFIVVRDYKKVFKL